MSYCRNCGNKLKDGARFCPRCGEQVFKFKPQKTYESLSENNNDMGGDWFMKLILNIAMIISSIIGLVAIYAGIKVLLLT